MVPIKNKNKTLEKKIIEHFYVWQFKFTEWKSTRTWILAMKIISLESLHSFL